jgi:hypothetical protein
MVRLPGLEPGSCNAADFKSAVSTYSTIGALNVLIGVDSQSQSALALTVEDAERAVQCPSHVDDRPFLYPRAWLARHLDQLGSNPYGAITSNAGNLNKAWDFHDSFLRCWYSNPERHEAHRQTNGWRVQPCRQHNQCNRVPIASLHWRQTYETHSYAYW